MKKLHNDLLQSAIIGTEQRRDKALHELIRLQSKLDELRKKAARLAKRAARERAENTARLQELEQKPLSSIQCPYCRFGFAPHVVDQHIREKHSAEQFAEFGTPQPAKLDPVTQVTLVTAPQQTDDNDPLDIPEWLLRRRVDVQQHKDKEAAEQIKAEQAERKQAKARVRIEKLKAKQRGDTRKVPLTGKAALKFIKEGA